MATSSYRDDALPTHLPGQGPPCCFYIAIIYSLSRRCQGLARSGLRNDHKKCTARGEHEPLLIDCSPQNQKPAEGTGNFISSSQPTSLTLKLYGMSLIFQRRQRGLTGNPVGLPQEKHYSEMGFSLFLCLSSRSTRFISLERGLWRGREDNP